MGWGVDIVGACKREIFREGKSLRVCFWEEGSRLNDARFGNFTRVDSVLGTRLVNKNELVAAT